MKVLFDNIDLGSTSGPNSFANKLKKYLELNHHECKTSIKDPDAQISFIETHHKSVSVPLLLRLDGIYFDIETDFVKKNKNILRSYNMADGVVFQSNYCKKLIFKYFGEHKKWTVIHNAADLEAINKAKALQLPELQKFENVWSCASSWYYNNNPATPRRWKRLKENVEFFLRHSPPNDCLVVAGNAFGSDQSVIEIENDRVFYAGILPTETLYSLYKTSKFFIHLASPDACPNVVVDARAAGCKVICSSVGGSSEIAGPTALVVKEEWDYDPIYLNGDRPIDLNNVLVNYHDSDIDMNNAAKKYEDFLKELL